MKVESVDCFYFSLPQIEDRADSSQDSFVVRIRSDTGLEGYGESDSSPVVAFACYCTPPSHSNIANLLECLIGQSLDTPHTLDSIQVHRPGCNENRTAGNLRERI